MFEQGLTYIIKTFLGEFVEGGSVLEERVNVAVWSGYIVLEGLELKRTILDALHLPISLSQGSIGRLELKIPWGNLGNEPVVLVIDKILLLLEPKYEWDTDRRESRDQAVKQAKLAAAELFAKQQIYQKHEESAFAKYRDFAFKWLVESVLSKIINNMQITIRDIHIRYEDQVSCPENLSFGMTLDYLHIQSVGDDYQEEDAAFKGPGTIRKILELSQFSVYWNPMKKNYGDICRMPYVNRPKQEIQYLLLKSIPKRVHVRSDRPNHHYLLEPCRMSLQISIHSSQPFRSKINILVPSIAVTIEDRQLLDMTNLSINMANFVQLEQYSNLRPKLSIQEDPKGWWRYSIQVVLYQIRASMKGTLSVRRLNQRISDKSVYMELWKSKISTKFGKVYSSLSLSERRNSNFRQSALYENLRKTSASKKGFSKYSSSGDSEDVDEDMSTNRKKKRLASARNDDYQESKSFKSNFTKEMSDLLFTMEYHLSYEDIRYFRLVAERDLLLQEKSNGSWVGSILSWVSGGRLNGTNSDEDRLKLAESLKFSPEDIYNSAEQSSTPIGSKEAAIKVILTHEHVSFILALSNPAVESLKPYSQSSVKEICLPFLEMQIASIKVEAELFPDDNHANLSVSMQDMELYGVSTNTIGNDTVSNPYSYSRVISRRRKGPLSQIFSRVDDSTKLVKKSPISSEFDFGECFSNRQYPVSLEAPLFEARIRIDPSSKEQEVTLDASMTELVMWISPHEPWIESILCFLKPPDDVQYWSEREMSSMNQLADFQSRLDAKLTYMVNNHINIVLKANINAPTILISSGSSRSTIQEENNTNYIQALVIDLGDIALRTESLAKASHIARISDINSINVSNRTINISMDEPENTNNESRILNKSNYDENQKNDDSADVRSAVKDLETAVQDSLYDVFTIKITDLEVYLAQLEDSSTDDYSKNLDKDTILDKFQVDSEVSVSALPWDASLPPLKLSVKMNEMKVILKDSVIVRLVEFGTDFFKISKKERTQRFQRNRFIDDTERTSNDALPKDEYKSPEQDSNVETEYEFYDAISEKSPSVKSSRTSIFRSSINQQLRATPKLDDNRSRTRSRSKSFDLLSNSCISRPYSVTPSNELHSETNLDSKSRLHSVRGDDSSDDLSVASFLSALPDLNDETMVEKESLSSLYSNIQQLEANRLRLLSSIRIYEGDQSKVSQLSQWKEDLSHCSEELQQLKIKYVESLVATEEFNHSRKASDQSVAEFGGPDFLYSISGAPARTFEGFSDNKELDKQRKLLRMSIFRARPPRLQSRRSRRSGDRSPKFKELFLITVNVTLVEFGLSCDSSDTIGRISPSRTRTMSDNGLLKVLRKRKSFRVYHSPEESKIRIISRVGGLAMKLRHRSSDTKLTINMHEMDIRELFDIGNKSLTSYIISSDAINTGLANLFYSDPNVDCQSEASDEGNDNSNANKKTAHHYDLSSMSFFQFKYEIFYEDIDQDDDTHPISRMRHNLRSSLGFLGINVDPEMTLRLLKVATKIQNEVVDVIDREWANASVPTKAVSNNSRRKYVVEESSNALNPSIFDMFTAFYANSVCFTLMSNHQPLVSLAFWNTSMNVHGSNSSTIISVKLKDISGYENFMNASLYNNQFIFKNHQSSNCFEGSAVVDPMNHFVKSGTYFKISIKLVSSPIDIHVSSQFLERIISSFDLNLSVVDPESMRTADSPFEKNSKYSGSALSIDNFIVPLLSLSSGKVSISIGGPKIIFSAAAVDRRSGVAYQEDNSRDLSLGFSAIVAESVWGNLFSPSGGVDMAITCQNISALVGNRPLVEPFNVHALFYSTPLADTMTLSQFGDLRIERIPYRLTMDKITDCPYAPDISHDIIKGQVILSLGLSPIVVFFSPSMAESMGICIAGFHDAIVSLRRQEADSSISKVQVARSISSITSNNDVEKSLDLVCNVNIVLTMAELSVTCSNSSNPRYEDSSSSITSIVLRKVGLNVNLKSDVSSRGRPDICCSMSYTIASMDIICPSSSSNTLGDTERALNDPSSGKYRFRRLIATNSMLFDNDNVNQSCMALEVSYCNRELVISLLVHGIRGVLISESLAKFIKTVVDIHSRFNYPFGSYNINEKSKPQAKIIQSRERNYANGLVNERPTTMPISDERSFVSQASTRVPRESFVLIHINDGSLKLPESLTSIKIDFISNSCGLWIPSNINDRKAGAIFIGCELKAFTSLSCQSSRRDVHDCDTSLTDELIYSRIDFKNVEVFSSQITDTVVFSQLPKRDVYGVPRPISPEFTNRPIFRVHSSNKIHSMKQVSDKPYYLSPFDFSIIYTLTIEKRQVNMPQEPSYSLCVGDINQNMSIKFHEVNMNLFSDIRLLLAIATRSISPMSTIYKLMTELKPKQAASSNEILEDNGFRTRNLFENLKLLLTKSSLSCSCELGSLTLLLTDNMVKSSGYTGRNIENILKFTASNVSMEIEVSPRMSMVERESITPIDSKALAGTPKDFSLHHHIGSIPEDFAWPRKQHEFTFATSSIAVSLQYNLFIEFNNDDLMVWEPYLEPIMLNLSLFAPFDDDHAILGSGFITASDIRHLGIEENTSRESNETFRCHILVDDCMNSNVTYPFIRCILRLADVVSFVFNSSKSYLSEWEKNTLFGVNSTNLETSNPAMSNSFDNGVRIINVTGFDASSRFVEDSNTYFIPNGCNAVIETVPTPNDFNTYAPIHSRDSFRQQVNHRQVVVESLVEVTFSSCLSHNPTASINSDSGNVILSRLTIPCNDYKTRILISYTFENYLNQFSEHSSQHQWHSYTIDDLFLLTSKTKYISEIFGNKLRNNVSPLVLVSENTQFGDGPSTIRLRSTLAVKNSSAYTLRIFCDAESTVEGSYWSMIIDANDSVFVPAVICSHLTTSDMGVSIVNSDSISKIYTNVVNDEVVDDNFESSKEGGHEFTGITIPQFILSTLEDGTVLNNLREKTNLTKENIVAIDQLSEQLVTVPAMFATEALVKFNKVPLRRTVELNNPLTIPYEELTYSNWVHVADIYSALNVIVLVTMKGLPTMQMKLKDDGRDMLTRNVEFLSPVRIHNCLPYNIDICVRESISLNVPYMEERPRSNGRIKPGEVHELVIFHPLQSFKLSIRFSDNSRAADWSSYCIVRRCQVNPTEKYEEYVEVDFYNQSILQVLLEVQESVSGVREIFIFVPYWLSTASNSTLLYQHDEYLTSFPPFTGELGNRLNGLDSLAPDQRSSNIDMIFPQNIEKKSTYLPKGIGKGRSTHGIYLAPDMPLRGLIDVLSIYQNNLPKVRTHTSTKSNQQLLASIENNEMMSGSYYHQFMLLGYTNHFSRKTRLRLCDLLDVNLSSKSGKFSWSNSFSIDNVGSKTVDLLHSEYSRSSKIQSKSNSLSQYRQSYGIIVTQISSKPFQRTKLVTIIDRYILMNQTRQDIEIRQVGSVEYNEYREVMNLASQHEVTMRWNAKKPMHLQIRIAKFEWQWSGTFSIEEEEITLRLRNEFGNVVCFVLVSIITHGPRVNIIFSDCIDGLIPYRIENHTLELFRMKQFKQKVSNILAPYHCCPYAWDEPLAPGVLSLDIADTSHGQHNWIEFGTYSFEEMPKEFIRECKGKILKVAISSQGPIRVLTIQNVSLQLSNQRMVNDTNTSLSRRRSIDLSIHIKLLGISLIDHSSEELVYFSSHGLSLCYSSTIDHYEDSFSIDIDKIQIDGQLLQTPYPCIFSPLPDKNLINIDRIGRVFNNTRSSEHNKNPFIRFHVVQNYQLSNLQYIPNLSFQIQPFDVNIDGNLIARILKYASVVVHDLDSYHFFRNQSYTHKLSFHVPEVRDRNSSDFLSPQVDYIVNKPIIDLIRQYRKDKVTNDTIKEKKRLKIYIQEMYISNIRFNVSFNPVGTDLSTISTIPSQSTSVFSDITESLRRISRSLSPAMSNDTYYSPQLRPSESIIVDALKTIFSALGSSLAKFENSHLRFLLFSKKNIYSSRRGLIDMITSHYLHQMLLQGIMLVASSQATGNLTQFVKTISDGMKDFLYLPLAGLRNSPHAFALGLIDGTSSLLRRMAASVFSVGGNFFSSLQLGMLTLGAVDVIDIRKHRRDKNHQQLLLKEDQSSKALINESSLVLYRPRNTIHGFKLAIKGFITDPIIGFQLHGIKGLLKGMVTAGLGLFTRPSYGTLVSLSNTFQQLSLSILPRYENYHKRYLTRVRPPRFLYRHGIVKPLTIYSIHENIGHELLSKVDYGDYMDNDYLWHCNIMVQEHDFMKKHIQNQYLHRQHIENQSIDETTNNNQQQEVKQYDLYKKTIVIDSITWEYQHMMLLTTTRLLLIRSECNMKYQFYTYHSEWMIPLSSMVSLQIIQAEDYDESSSSLSLLDVPFLDKKMVLRIVHFPSNASKSMIRDHDMKSPSKTPTGLNLTHKAIIFDDIKDLTKLVKILVSRIPSFLDHHIESFLEHEDPTYHPNHYHLSPGRHQSHQA